jgi:hypothetical protein
MLKSQIQVFELGPTLGVGSIFWHESASKNVNSFFDAISVVSHKAMS